MIKIGILPTYNPNENRPFLNTFSFVTNYAKKIKENGATPIGILFPQGFNQKDLEGIDGFLIPGGTIIRAYHIQTYHYIITKNIPYLGICMGLQVINVYNYIKNKIEQAGQKLNYHNIEKYFNQEDEQKVLKKIYGHNIEDPFYTTSIKKSSHKIYLNTKSKLYHIYKKSTIIEPSIHDYSIKDADKDYIISATDKEGNIEGIEHQTKSILAVQFHPELESKNNILFKYFIDLCRR